jgi:hypothetical protein
MAVVLEGEAAVSDRNVELFTQLVLRGVAAAPPPTTTRTTEKDRR